MTGNKGLTLVQWIVKAHGRGHANRKLLRDAYKLQKHLSEPKFISSSWIQEVLDCSEVEAAAYLSIIEFYISYLEETNE